MFVKCYQNGKMVQIIDMGNLLQEKGTVVQGIFLLNAEGKIIYSNEKADEFFAIKKGKSFLSVIPKEDRKKIYSSYKKLSRGESILYVSDSIKGKSLEISIHPVVEGKKLMMFVGTIRDITKIKEIELHAKKIVKREKIFREDVSHYFFNPLVIADGYLQLLLNEEQGGEERRRLEAIKAAVERIETVVKNTVIRGRIEE